MKKSNLLFLFLLNMSLMGSSSYRYVDIRECILPINKKLEKINKNTWKEKDNNFTISYPATLVIEKKDDNVTKIVPKIIKILQLNKKISINGFEGYTNNRQPNNTKLFFLKKNILFFINIPSEEVQYILSYCRKTKDRKKSK